MIHENERWDYIQGFGSWYKISTLGRVLSIRSNIFLKQIISDGKYNIVNLSHKGYRDRFYVHRLVAESFLQKANGKNEVNHLNGDKQDNRLVNLEWVNRSENARHASEIGLMPRGELHSNTKLTKKQVLEIRDRYSNENISQYMLAIEYGVKQPCICRVINGKRWSHI